MAFNTAADAGIMRHNGADGNVSNGDLGGRAVPTISPSKTSCYYISTLTFHLSGPPLGLVFNLQT